MSRWKEFRNGSLWNAVEQHGSPFNQGLQGAIAGGLGFADGYEEDVVGGQGDIGRLTAQDGLKINRNLGPVIGAGLDAHNFSVFGGRGLFGAFGEGENLEGAEAAVLAKNVRSRFLDGADDIDRIRFRDGDDVVGLDQNVFRRDSTRSSRF